MRLLEKVMTLNDYIADPNAFDCALFQDIQRESELYRDETIQVLHALYQQALRHDLQQFRLPPQDGPLQLQGTRQTAAIRPPSMVSPTQDIPTALASPFVAHERRTTSTSGTSQYDLDIPRVPSHGSYRGEGDVSSPTPALGAPNNDEEDLALKLINRDEVNRQLNANEQLLEKRKRTKASFHHHMETLRNPSIYSASTMSPRPSFAHSSPVRESASEFSSSPTLASRSNSTMHITRSPSREGHATASPRVSKPQDSLSIRERMDSVAPEPAFLGPPAASFMSSGRKSAVEDWVGEARTLKVPGFVERVEEGKEVVGQLVSDHGLMLADENHDQPKAMAPVLPTYPIRHDSSFYNYGGFCDVAEQLVGGQSSAIKVVKKLGGDQTALFSMKCGKCSYEISSNVYERDSTLDRAGIYSQGELRLRQKFLFKCHVATKHSDDPVYACIFCIKDDKTADEYDATVFFSQSQFFRHLQKHTRPVKAVEGVAVLYGSQPDAADFDVHFKAADPKVNPFHDITAKLASLPKAHAIVNHRERAKGFKGRDPDRCQTLQFALGARIVGITYPPRFNGTWCQGYHDGDKACFPASTIALEPPSTEELTSNPKSTLFATAKWDHKPRDTTSGWLKFSKKDKITNISFQYQEAWCWTGQNPKGKWGFFPASFVEGLDEDIRLSSGPPPNAPSQDVPAIAPLTARRTDSLSLSRLSSRPLQRRATADHYAATENFMFMASPTFSVGMTRKQPKHKESK